MLAYIDGAGQIQVWNGQSVNGITYQCNIDQLWSDFELNAIGIYRVQEFQVPSGQQIANLTPAYILTNNVVIQTYSTEPIPVTTVSSTKGATAIAT